MNHCVRLLGRVVILATLLIGRLSSSASACPCDCDQDCNVTVDELLTVINVALGTLPADACAGADVFGSGGPEIDDIITCVGAALAGCPAEGTCERRDHCFNGMVEGDEECDDGGTCVGGTNAGAQCFSSPDCVGNGRCDDGPYVGRACTQNSGCPDSFCIYCKTFGGDGCSAYCTLETDLDVLLENGVLVGNDIKPGTSGAVLNGDGLIVPLPLTGRFKLTVGKPRRGLTPVVIRASTVELRRVEVPTLVDACLRMPALQTCGGTVFEADGTPSVSCTPGFASAGPCPSTRPCAPAFGAGNAAMGVIAFGDTALVGIDVSAIGQSGGVVDASRSGHGAAGSVQLLGSLALTTVDSPDACTDADPPEARGIPFALPLTTGTATGAIAERSDMAALGPISVRGAPLDSQTLWSTSPAIVGLGLAGAWPHPSPVVPGDLVLTLRLFSH